MFERRLTPSELDRLKRLDGEYLPRGWELWFPRAFAGFLFALGIWLATMLYRSSADFAGPDDARVPMILGAIAALVLLALGALLYRRSGFGYRFGTGLVSRVTLDGTVQWTENLATLESAGAGRGRGTTWLLLRWSGRRRFVIVPAALAAALAAARTA